MEKAKIVKTWGMLLGCVLVESELERKMGFVDSTDRGEFGLCVYLLVDGFWGIGCGFV